jgi:ABC-2 type transport system permease protein
MFVVTSITTLRERTSGTLERLMATPLGKVDLLAGYGIAFALVATVQATLVSAVSFLLLGLDVEGSPAAVGAIGIGNAVLGMSLGLFVSAFARTEFQAVQFMPAFVTPQMLLCGLFVPRSQMARALEVAADALPLTYAFDALDRVATRGSLGSRGHARRARDRGSHRSRPGLGIAHAAAANRLVGGGTPPFGGDPLVRTAHYLPL